MRNLRRWLLRFCSRPPPFYTRESHVYDCARYRPTARALEECMDLLDEGQTDTLRTHLDVLYAQQVPAAIALEYRRALAGLADYLCIH